MPLCLIFKTVQVLYIFIVMQMKTPSPRPSLTQLSERCKTHPGHHAQSTPVGTVCATLRGNTDNQTWAPPLRSLPRGQSRQQGGGRTYFLQTKMVAGGGHLAGSGVEHLPSAQEMILGPWDRVLHRAPCMEPASPSAFVSASLSVSLMNK